jgi:hypothetical protein
VAAVEVAFAVFFGDEPFDAGDACFGWSEALAGDAEPFACVEDGFACFLPVAPSFPAVACEFGL